MEQKRWKSPVVWAAIIAQVASLLLLTGVIDTGLEAKINEAAGLVLQLLIVLGVFNNPTDKENW